MNEDLPKKIILQTGLENHTVIDLTSEVDWYDVLCRVWQKDKELVILGFKLIFQHGNVSSGLVKSIIAGKDDLDELYDDYMRIVEKKQ